MGRQKNKRRRSDPHKKDAREEKAGEKIGKKIVTVERNANEKNLEECVEKALGSKSVKGKFNKREKETSRADTQEHKSDFVRFFFDVQTAGKRRQQIPGFPSLSLTVSVKSSKEKARELVAKSNTMLEKMYFSHFGCNKVRQWLVSPFLCCSWQLQSAKLWDTVHKRYWTESLWSTLKEVTCVSSSFPENYSSTVCQCDPKVSSEGKTFSCVCIPTASESLVDFTLGQKRNYYGMPNEHLSTQELVLTHSECYKLPIDSADLPSIFSQDKRVFAASLENILQMLRKAQKCELKDDVLRQTRYLKKQLEFVHDVLLNMQLIASPNDVLDFIIQQNLVTSDSDSKKIHNPTAALRKWKNEACISERSHDLLLGMEVRQQGKLKSDKFEMGDFRQNLKDNFHFHSFGDSSSNSSNNNTTASTRMTSTPKLSCSGSLHNKDNFFNENAIHICESPVTESLNSPDSFEWLNEDSDENLCHEISNEHFDLPSVKNFLAAVAIEFARAGVKSWSYHKCPCPITSYHKELKKNFQSKFRLYVHTGRNIKTLPVKNSCKTREICPVVKRERNSLWLQYYTSLNNLVSIVLHEVKEDVNFVIYSSHWYYTLKQGCFGTYLGISSCGLPVVVKCMDSLSLYDRKLSVLQDMRKKEVQHENLAKFYGAYFSRESFCTYVISEVCEFNLTEYLTRPKENILGSTGEPIDAQFLIIQLIKAMAYLHELPEPIIHGHLKPENILIDCNSRLKVADFFLVHARPPVYSVGNADEREHRMSSLSWKARELLDALYVDEARKYSTVYSDIQVVGMLIYHIFSVGRHPFGTTDKECYENIRSGYYELRGRPAAIEGQDLVEEMIKYTPHKRLTMSKALSHPYFWTLGKRFELLLHVEKKLDIIIRKNPFTYEMLRKSCLESRDWLSYIQDDLFQFMKKKRTYENNFVDLLHFFAVLDESFPSMPCYMRKFLEDPAKYVLCTFPTIFMSVYCVLRKNRILQRQLKIDLFFYDP